MIRPDIPQIDLKVEVAGLMFKNPIVPAAKDLERERVGHAFQHLIKKEVKTLHHSMRHRNHESIRF